MFQLPTKNTDYKELEQKEYLSTNKFSSYSSSSIINLNTRKYHGLFVYSDQDLNHYQLLPNIEESITIDGQETFFSNQKYFSIKEQEEVLSPKGYEYKTQFEQRYFPTFYYDLPNNIKLKKQIILLRHKNILIITYEFIDKNNKPKTLKLLPFLNHRLTHNLTKEKNLNIKKIEDLGDQTTFQLNNLYISFYLKDSHSTDQNFWYDNIYYNKEQHRGYESKENLFSPNKIEIELNQPQQMLFLIISVGKSKEESLKQLEEIKQDPKKTIAEEVNYQKQLLQNFYKNKHLKQNDFLNSLIISADSFIVNKHNNKTIIAGYPYFKDYSRDTFVSLEGLTLLTNRFEDARQIIQNWSKQLKDGLFPNTFQANSKPIYNSSDAPLWFFQAIYKYYFYTKDKHLLKEQIHNLTQIITSYIKGNQIIKPDPDGLIIIKDSSSTWMDANTNGLVHTPRDKKPIELQALWFNALSIYEYLLSELNINPPKTINLEELKQKVLTSSQKLISPKGYLYDTLEPQRDEIRPNQLIAISLPFHLFAKEQEQKILKTIQKYLLTPLGLKTLNEQNPKYHPLYHGNQQERDEAYHNGTIWPFLLCFYVESFLYQNNYSRLSKIKMLNLLNQTQKLQSIYAIGHIPEIIEAQTNRPDGCLAQAWSTSELLRAYLLAHS